MEQHLMLKSLQEFVDSHIEMDHDELIEVATKQLREWHVTEKAMLVGIVETHIEISKINAQINDANMEIARQEGEIERTTRRIAQLQHQYRDEQD
jgi:hypothetical protein